MSYIQYGMCCVTQYQNNCRLLILEFAATLKVMYPHEIICTGNTAKFNSQLFVCEQCSGCLVLKKS